MQNCPASPEAPQISELDLDALMERIRAEVEARKREAMAENAVAAEDGLLSGNVRPRASELLALPEADFVRLSCAAIFGRPPNPEEFVILRDRLLSGEITRTRLLLELLATEEARRRGARIEGLSQSLAADNIRRSFPARLAKRIAHAARTVYLLPRRIRQFLRRIDAIERTAGDAILRTNSLEQRLAQTKSATQSGTEDLERALAESIGAADSFRSEFAATTEAIASRLGATDRALEKIAERVVDLEQDVAYSAKTFGAKAEVVEQAIAETRDKLFEHWRAIVEHKHRIEALCSATQNRPLLETAPGPAAAGIFASDPLLDAFYISFEDRYRGTRADIKNRLLRYLDPVAACFEATPGGLVIDVGCGRGEWLELLAEAGIPALGFDLNRIAVEENTARGLDARLGDAFEALAMLADDSVSVVTGFHIAEHLPFEYLVKLLDQCLRVLRPAGMIVLETPNPANFLVATERFYLDPTHRNPLPSELMAFIVKARGFEAVKVEALHPIRWEHLQEYADPMLAVVQEKLFGPQDYCVMGWKGR